ncbi:MAG: ribonuclease PH [Candidatus Hodarchaeota archaeon]
MSLMRRDGRRQDEMRPVKATKQFNKFAEGSVLFETGDTKVIITVTVQDDVPPWLKDSGKGWVTAEYSMLPRSTHSRQQRERSGRPNNRNIELSRLIGRALRPIMDMDALGQNTLRVDCDVIQADGGTRCASITGAYIALKQAEKWLMDEGYIYQPIIKHAVAAISVGILEGNIILDLNYHEDSKVDVDLNVIMMDTNKFIEIQGTAEHDPFPRDKLNAMLDMAEKGLAELFEIQKTIL